MTDDDIKGTWYWGSPNFPQLGHHITMRHPRTAPCNCQCPWLADNHGKLVTLFYDHEVPGIEMPDEFEFALRKRVEVWATDLKDGVHGYGSLCHVRLPGTGLRDAEAWNIVGRQCTGALVMQQRELVRHVKHGESALSPQGAARVASDMLGREIAADDVRALSVRDLLAHANPSLLDPKIGCDAVAPPLSEQKMQEWGRLRSLD